MSIPAFCVRRLVLVLILLLLDYHKQGMIFTYLVMYSAYLWFLTHSKPNDNALHNYLEVFNEFALILLHYLMFSFSYGSFVDPLVQWEIGFAAMGLIGLIFILNLALLIYLTICRLIFAWRCYKAR